MESRVENKNIFLNPYNFVSPSKNVEKHVVEYGKLTGQLKCVIKPETPLFISGKYTEKEHHKIYEFFKTPDQIPTIPATSLKGVVRSIYEVLTNSCMKIMDTDRKLYYRSQSKGQHKNILLPARISQDDKDNYMITILRGMYETHKKANGKACNTLAFVVISDFYQQEKQGKKYINIQRNEDYKQLKHGQQIMFKLNDKKIDNGTYRFWSTSEVKEYNQEDYNPDTMKVGYICITNNNMDKKKYERIFVEKKDDKVITLEQCIIEQYNALLKEYYDIHSQEEKCTQAKYVAGKKVVEHSRFIIEKEELKEGDLVYAELTEEEKIVAIYPVEQSRKSYQYAIGDFIEQGNEGCSDFEALCPACRLFGWVNSKEAEKDKIQALAGRVFFNDAKLIAGKLSNNTYTLQELSAPKPTTTFFYLKDRTNGISFIPKDKGYNKKQNYIIRGRKFYLRHPRESVKKSAFKGQIKTKRNRTIKEYADTDCKFECLLDFERLTDQELKMLIASIQLKEHLVHRLGYGKPLGLGSVQITIDTKESFLYDENYLSLKVNKKPIDESYYKCEWNNLELEAILGNNLEEPICYPYVVQTIKSNSNNQDNFKWFKIANDKKVYLPKADNNKGLIAYTSQQKKKSSKNNKCINYKRRKR